MFKNKKKKITPGVIWITGLSGSGKSTVAKIIVSKLKKKYSNILFLDGDNLRKKYKIKKKNSFDNNSRKKIGLFYAKLCQKYSKEGKLVIISVMALLKNIHNWNKKNITNYKDVFLDVPIYELIKRDPKKIYKNYFEGKFSDVAGLDLQYDIPKNPFIGIKWNKSMTKNKIAKIIMEKIS